MKLNLTIIVPVYNEEESLASGIKSFLIFFRNHPKIKSFEIIIIDNGSVDHTYNIGEKLAVNSKEIRVIKVEKRGLGLALFKGISQAEYPYIYFNAIDNPFQFKDFNKFLEEINNNDIVFASKNHPEAIYNAPFLRKLSSTFLSFITQLLFHLALTDTQGTFLGKREKLTLLLETCTSSGAFFQTQLAIYAAISGYKISEVPVVYQTMGRKSKFSLVKDGSKIILELIAEKIKTLRHEIRK